MAQAINQRRFKEYTVARCQTYLCLIDVKAVINTKVVSERPGNANIGITPDIQPCYTRDARDGGREI